MISDKEILKILKKKDKIAFVNLYDNYAPALYGSIKNLINDDAIACIILTKSFLIIWASLDTYCTAKRSLFTWMAHITTQQAYTSLNMGCNIPGDVEGLKGKRPSAIM